MALEKQKRRKWKNKVHVILSKSVSGIDFNSDDQQSEENGDESTAQDEVSDNEQSSQSDFENWQFTSQDEDENE